MTALRAWYVDVLGVPLGVAAEFEGKAAYTEGQIGTSWFALLMPEWLDRPKGSGAGIVFEVDDIHTMIANLRERGVTVEDPVEFPICTMASLTDPEGNKISIHQAKP